MSNGLVFIVSAPSGAGKTTLCNMAIEHFPTLIHSVSYTTRDAREGEVDGVQYHFIKKKKFDEMAVEGEFVEDAVVHGSRYGTSGKDLERLCSSGVEVIVEIDVQGARQLKERLPGAVFIFILPPSVKSCEERLRQRDKDSDEEISKRLDVALLEIKKCKDYDYIIINDDLEKAFDELRSVITAEKVKRERVIKRVKEIFDF